MLESFVGKKVEITTGSEGESTQYGLTVKKVEGTLIFLEYQQGDVFVINTASPNFFEMSEDN